MQTYVDSIQQAAYIFPPLALAFTIPYLIYDYKKYGSIMSLRLWIIYSLYAMHLLFSDSTASFSRKSRYLA